MSDVLPLDQAHPNEPGLTPADPFDLPGSFSHTLTSAQPGCAPAAAASSVFDWRGPGRPPARVEPDPISQDIPTEPPTEQEMPVTKHPAAKSAAPRPTNAGPQFRVLIALCATPQKALSLPDLEKATSLTGKALSNGLYNLKKKKLVERLEDGGYQITPAGIDSALANRPGADVKFGSKKPLREPHFADIVAKGRLEREHRRDQALAQAKAKARAPASKRSLATKAPASTSGFFTALTSDGRFLISKADQQIVLDDSEYRQMCAYQQRVTVEAR